MGHSWASRDEGNADREHLAGAGLPPDQGTSRSEPNSEKADLEAGWRAVHALMRVRGDRLLTIMMRPSFRPVREGDLVPVSLCQACLDGALRMAGSVRTRHGRQPVRACDTCGIVMIGETRMPPARQ